MDEITVYPFTDATTGEIWLSTSSEPTLHEGRTFRPWLGDNDGPYCEYEGGRFFGPLYNYADMVGALYPRG